MPYKNKADRNAHHKQRMLEDSEYKKKHNSKNKEWADKNPNKVQDKNKRLYSTYTEKQMKDRAVYTKLWRTLNPGKIEAFNEQRKVKVLSYYGKDKTLQCCWEGCSICDPDMLSIDHVNNDGAKDRKTRRTGNSLYLSLEKDGYPEGFQTLCHNHQWKKEILRRKSLRMQKAKERLSSLGLDLSNIFVTVATTPLNTEHKILL
jgi:hypothetical protein